MSKLYSKWGSYKSWKKKNQALILLYRFQLLQNSDDLSFFLIVFPAVDIKLFDTDVIAYTQFSFRIRIFVWSK